MITSHNPQRHGKAAKKPTPKILKAVRYHIEQGNGYIKNEVMKNFWTLVKGLKAKTIFALTTVLAIQALAIFNLILRAPINQNPRSKDLIGHTLKYI